MKMQIISETMIGKKMRNNRASHRNNNTVTAINNLEVNLTLLPALPLCEVVVGLRNHLPSSRPWTIDSRTLTALRRAVISRGELVGVARCGEDGVCCVCVRLVCVSDGRRLEFAVIVLSDTIGAATAVVAVLAEIEDD